MSNRCGIGSFAVTTPCQGWTEDGDGDDCSDATSRRPVGDGNWLTDVPAPRTSLALGLSGALRRYLHGADQDISVVSLPDTEVNAVARARAFGASASVVYKFTNNIYGRFGALLKLGGKTEGVIYQKSVFSEAEAEAFGVPEGSYSETNYKEDFHGHFPLGFVGALGYKYDLDDNFSMFVEAEYYGISLKRKDSEISEFNTDVKLPDGTVAVSGLYTIDNLPEGVNRTTTYVDNLSNTNTDTSKELSQKVPYSSFGLNIGITYKFNKATN